MTAAKPGLSRQARTALAGHQRAIDRLAGLLARGQDPDLAVLTLTEMGVHAAQVHRLRAGGEPLPLQAAGPLDVSTPEAAAERAAGRPVVRLHITDAEAEWQRSVIGELRVLLGKVASLERSGAKRIGLPAFRPLRDLFPSVGGRAGAA